MASEPVDNEIRRRIQSNDPSALDLLWSEYASDLLGYLVSLHRSRHEAEDTLQEVFVRVAAKRHHVASARRLKPYLFKMARNTAFNRIKRGTRARENSYLPCDWLENGTHGPHDELRTLRLTEALAGLPEKQRTVLVLKYYRGKTLQEIGVMLGISGNTAASRLRYGMEKLRKQLLEDPI